MDSPFLGTISLFGGNFAPRGWALCNGQLLAISTNTALFSILGTTYGGDGRTTFALPDLRSRAPIHWGQGLGLSNYVIGEVTGTENVTLLQTQIPAHSHTVKAVSSLGDQNAPTNFYLATGNDTASGDIISGYSDAAPDTTLNPNSISLTGGNQPHSNIQPVLAVTYIIALQGIFPARN